MRIIAFITDPVEIKKIMKSQGIPQFRAPPPFPNNMVFDFNDVSNDISNLSDPIPDYDVHDDTSDYEQ